MMSPALPLLFIVIVLGALIIPGWIIFTKAGKQGWKVLIPVYNAYVWVEIAGLPWWVFLGFFIPVINVVTLVAVCYKVSQRFGHDMGYALGMIFLPFIFLPIIAYGDSVYTPARTPQG